MKRHSILKLFVFALILAFPFLPAAAQEVGDFPEVLDNGAIVDTGTVISENGFTVQIPQNEFTTSNFPTFGQTLPQNYAQDLTSTYGTPLPVGGTTGNTTWATNKQAATNEPVQYGLLAPGSFAGNGVIPSGQYTFGFGAGIPSINGGFPTLPPTATSSVDLNITDDN